MPTAIANEEKVTLCAVPRVNAPVAELPVAGQLKTGEVTVLAAKPATLVQDTVDVYAGPSADSGVVMRFQRNGQFDLIGQVQGDGGTWVKIRGSAGSEGFIAPNTRVSTVSPPAPTSRDAALKNMGVGALFCIGGIVITSVTYSNASQNGGSYYVMWGPVLFGGWQFLKGLLQYLGD